MYSEVNGLICQCDGTLQYIRACSVILLQIVMVSPMSHFVKNHECQLRNNKSKIENAWVLQYIT